MIRFWSVICLSHFVLTQPLQTVQYNAIMNVYESLGSSVVDIKSYMTSFWALALVFFSCRLRRNAVPAIQCVIELCWLGVGLCWW
jgi:hypothetical protein